MGGIQFSEMLAEKRIAPINSSIPDVSESLTMLGSFSAPPWSCIKSRNPAGDARTLKPMYRRKFLLSSVIFIVKVYMVTHVATIGFMH